MITQQRIHRLQAQLQAALMTNGSEPTIHVLLEQLTPHGMQHVVDVFQLAHQAMVEHEPTVTFTAFCSIAELQNACGMNSEQEALGLFKHIISDARLAVYGQTQCLEFSLVYTQTELIKKGLVGADLEDMLYKDSQYSIPAIALVLREYEQRLKAVGYLVRYSSRDEMFYITPKSGETRDLFDSVHVARETITTVLQQETNDERE